MGRVSLCLSAAAGMGRCGAGGWTAAPARSARSGHISAASRRWCWVSGEGEPLLVSGGWDGALRGGGWTAAPARSARSGHTSASSRRWCWVSGGELCSSAAAGMGRCGGGPDGSPGPLSHERAHIGVVPVLVLGEWEGEPLLVSGGGDGALRSWRLDGSPGPLSHEQAHIGVVEALVLGEWEGEPLLVGGGGDGALRGWRLDGGPGPLSHERAHSGARPGAGAGRVGRGSRCLSAPVWMRRSSSAESHRPRPRKLTTKPLSLRGTPRARSHRPVCVSLECAVREPVCAGCIERANANRHAAGRELIAQSTA